MKVEGVIASVVIVRACVSITQDGVKSLGSSPRLSSENNNDQDDYDTSVLFDSGMICPDSRFNQSIACPRAVSVGPKGSVRRYDECLANISSSVDSKDIAWEEGIEKHVIGGKRREKGNDGVEYYQDFMKTFSDGVRVHVVNTIQRYSTAEDSWSTHGDRCPIHSDDLGDIEDSIRRMAERSNRVDGFIYFADDTSTWGHVTKYLLEDSQEEYHGKSTYLFATRSETYEEHYYGPKKLRKNLLEGLATSYLSQLADVYVPMHDSLQYFNITNERSHLYQSSLANAVGIYGATIPFMKRYKRVEMQHLGQFLSGWHQCPLATLDTVFPAANTPPVSFTDPTIRYDIDIHKFSNFISYIGCDRDVIAASRHTMAGNATLESLFSHGLPTSPSLSKMIPVLGRSEAPLISILGSTKSFSGKLQSLRDHFVKNAAAESALVESWGVSQEEVMESAEVLSNMVDRLGVSQ